MTEKTLTTENIKPALDALRGELAPWPVVAKKQDRLNDTQKSAVNSGITSSLVAQIIANTAAIRALESAITGTGLRALVVASLPAIGTQGILYIVPVTTYDPATDADVVNYSNEYIWIPVEGGTASEGHYEQVGQTGIVINNGQLNITVNGTSVGTFTANQSGDTTAAITVPTNADYVDLSTDQTVAGVKTFSSTINGTAAKAVADEDGTSIKTGYVNVAGNQTVTGDKSWTGSNTFNNILPNATNTYSLGSSSYQWSSVYAQTYYYNGTAWGLDKANTWTNVNTFSGSTNTVVNLQRGGSSYYSDIRFADETSHVLGCIRASTELQIGCQRSSNWADGSQILLKNNGSLQFVLNDGTNTTNIIANATEIKPTNSVADLGTSTNQWKSVYSQTYYYNGTAWGLDKANVWTGENTFSSTLKQVNSTVTKGTIPQSDTTAFSLYWGGTVVTSLNNALFAQRGYVNTDGSTTYTLYALENAAGGTHTQFGLKYDPNDTVNKRYAYLRGDFRPYADNAFNLGTLTNKWKTLNGVNPGALSLPKTDALITISVSGFLFDGSDEFMPDVSGLFSSGIAQINGWLVVRLKEGTGHYIFLNSNISASTPGVIQSCFSPGVVTTLQFGLSCYVPVCTGHKPSVRWAKPDGGNASIYFIPCLGNV